MASQVCTFFSMSLLLFLTYAHYVNGGGPQFSYLGPSGPKRWGSLSPTYSTCSNGVFRLNGKNYSLVQMHWHSPSEHHLDGVRYDVELHLVHKSVDGEVSVIAVLYHYGHPDPLLSKIQTKLAQLGKMVHKSSHEQAQIVIGTITTKQIRKHSRKYYRYVGSFSTPPCTQGVIWNILGKVRSISREQVSALKEPLIFGCKSNSRPVQPLNGRKIEMFDDEMSH
ncbi:alpha carbonic anhydrase 1, chloroplastic-like isoform X2 [Rutidosis leptorrhynchoides]|uniref:alpha carbonic anhydrase 1, chloroplastic-like isoform X2 n=1 Tax=Rutidosis leptorrhynchoides TaxID=125765 RepID=UPI003A99D495